MLSGVGSSGSQGAAGASGGDDGKDKRGTGNGGIDKAKPEPAKATKGALESPSGNPISSGAMAAAPSAIGAGTSSTSTSSASTSATSSAAQSPSDNSGARPRQRNVQGDTRLDMPEEGSKKSSKSKGWKRPTGKQLAFGGLLLASGITTRYMMQAVGNMPSTSEAGNGVAPLPPGSGPLPEHQGAGALVGHQGGAVPGTPPILPPAQPANGADGSDATNDGDLFPLPQDTQTDADLARMDSWLATLDRLGPRTPGGAEGGQRSDNYRDLGRFIERNDRTSWHVSGVWVNSEFVSLSDLPLRATATDGDRHIDRTLWWGDRMTISHRPSDASALETIQIQVDTRAITGAGTYINYERGGSEAPAPQGATLPLETVRQLSDWARFTAHGRMNAIANGAEMTSAEARSAFVVGLINYEQYDAMRADGAPRTLPDEVRNHLSNNLAIVSEASASASASVEAAVHVEPPINTQVNLTPGEVRQFMGMFRGNTELPTPEDLMENFNVQIYAGGDFTIQRPSAVSIDSFGQFVFTFEGNPHNYPSGQQAFVVLLPRDLDIYRPHHPAGSQD